MVFVDYSNSPIITTYEFVDEQFLEMPIIEVCLGNPVNATNVRRLKLAPVIVNYALLSLAKYEMQENDVRMYAKKNRIIRAEPKFYSVVSSF